MPSLTVRNVEIDGRPGLDCRIADGRIVAVGPSLPGTAATEVDGHGGALVPGLADHHIHLLATAAHAESVDITGADDIRSAVGAAAARVADPEQGVRVVGYDPDRHGPLDRARLDQLTGEVPVRVQDRSGALWVLNSAALARVGIDRDPPATGVERDPTGTATGRLWRCDGWLAERSAGPPLLASLGAGLARLGVTAVTDATPDIGPAAVAALATALDRGELPQRLQLLGADDVPDAPRLCTGPKKIVVADHELPSLDLLVDVVRSARATHRPVAFHCVSRAALALVIATLDEVGVVPGDRVEHVAIADDSGVAALARLGVIVVTQPSLVALRGDDYVARHAPDEVDDLWRHQSLLTAGVPVVASSDAPYGALDPWETLRAARDRTTASGAVVGAAERVPPATVIRGMWGLSDDPATPRRVAAGEFADLVLLRSSLAAALADPSADVVAMTLVDGRVVYSV